MVARTVKKIVQKTAGVLLLHQPPVKTPVLLLAPGLTLTAALVNQIGVILTYHSALETTAIMDVQVWGGKRMATVTAGMLTMVARTVKKIVQKTMDVKMAHRRQIAVTKIATRENAQTVHMTVRLQTAAATEPAMFWWEKTTQTVLRITALPLIQQAQ